MTTPPSELPSENIKAILREEKHDVEEESLTQFINFLHEVSLGKNDAYEKQKRLQRRYTNEYKNLQDNLNKLKTIKKQLSVLKCGVEKERVNVDAQAADVFKELFGEDGLDAVFASFTEGTNKIHKTLEKEIADGKAQGRYPKKGSPEKKLKKLHIAHVCVLMDCFLEIKINKSDNPGTLFARVFDETMKMIESLNRVEGARKYSREVKPCFDDPNILGVMKSHYSSYGYPELYEQHRQKAKP